MTNRSTPAPTAPPASWDEKALEVARWAGHLTGHKTYYEWEEKVAAAILEAMHWAAKPPAATTGMEGAFDTAIAIAKESIVHESSPATKPPAAPIEPLPEGDLARSIIRQRRSGQPPSA